MSWNLFKLRPKSRDNSKRSEEVSDIIDRMPTAFGFWVAMAVLLFSCLLFLFGWLIKYPDVVTGQIKINSNITPVKLLAHTSGKIQLLGFQPQESVKEGEYIAVIQNPARTEDIRRIASLLHAFDPNDLASFDPEGMFFPEKVSLGELNMKYYSFLSSLKNLVEYYKNNIYDQQRINLQDGIEWKKQLLKETENTLLISNENLGISEKWLNRYSSVNKELVTTNEYELDRSKLEYLSAKQQSQHLIKELVSIRMQITESQNLLSQLRLEKNEKERHMHLELLASYHDLNDQIKQWEQTYVFKASFDGQVEYLKFWTDNQFVLAGEEVFGIVPRESTILGQVFLPATGAGKVKTGSPVSIKLEDYPYAEFGSLKGVVKSISLITNEQKVAEWGVNTYLVLVEMPDGLITNYGETLDFKYEIGGVADIIVKDRRLVERLFDNIKFNTK